VLLDSDGNPGGKPYAFLFTQDLLEEIVHVSPVDCVFPLP
jgi:hypothetical protein